MEDVLTYFKFYFSLLIKGDSSIKLFFCSTFYK